MTLTPEQQFAFNAILPLTLVVSVAVMKLRRDKKRFAYFAIGGYGLIVCLMLYAGYYRFPYLILIYVGIAFIASGGIGLFRKSSKPTDHKP